MTREYRGGFIAGVALPKATLAIVWGLCCFFPGSLFATSPVYAKYGETAPEWAWGVFAIVCGLAQIWGTYKGRAPSIMCGGLALVAFYLFGAILFLQASTRSAAGYIYLLFAFWQILVCLSVGDALGKRE